MGNFFAKLGYALAIAAGCMLHSAPAQAEQCILFRGLVGHVQWYWPHDVVRIRAVMWINYPGDHVNQFTVGLRGAPVFAESTVTKSCNPTPDILTAVVHLNPCNRIRGFSLYKSPPCSGVIFGDTRLSWFITEMGEVLKETPATFIEAYKQTQYLQSEYNFSSTLSPSYVHVHGGQLNVGAQLALIPLLLSTGERVPRYATPPSTTNVVLLTPKTKYPAEFAGSDGAVSYFAEGRARGCRGCGPAPDYLQ